MGTTVTIQFQALLDDLELHFLVPRAMAIIDEYRSLIRGLDDSFVLAG